MNSPLRLPVAERSQAAEARRLCSDLARSMGFSEVRTGEVAIIASEVAANLANHARQGELLVNTPDESTIQILSIDHGPGMDLTRSLEDGYSTGGTAGTGLGAIRRLSTTFDAWSDASGTVLLSQVEAKGLSRGTLLTGVAQASFPGETQCGDACTVRQFGSLTAILIADGLGHGPFAADAARESVNAFWQMEWYGVADAIEFLHRALRGTRGAAVAVAAFDPDRRRITYSGLGNTAGVILTNDKSQSMVSHNGTAGHNASRIAQFEYVWPENSVVIMHTDGVSTSWSLSRYSGISHCHPAIISALLYRDFSRRRDDVTVITAVERLR